MWLSAHNDSNGVAYEEWCIDNLPEEDYVIDLLTNAHKSERFVSQSAWLSPDYMSVRHVVIWFTRDIDAMLFKLANSDLIAHKSIISTI